MYLPTLSIKLNLKSCYNYLKVSDIIREWYGVVIDIWSDALVTKCSTGCLIPIQTSAAWRKIKQPLK